MKRPAEFWDRIAKKYSKSPIGDKKAYEYTLSRTRSYLMRDDRVLELGCGTGSTAILLAPDVRSFTATDYSEQMLSIARAKLEENPVSNLSFEMLDIEKQPPTPGSFNVVMGHSLFHLVTDMETVFDQISQILPQGGLFISKTPCLGGPGMGVKGWLIRTAIPIMQWIGKAPYVRSFSSSELVHAISEAGFDIIENGDFPKGPPPAHYVVARKR